MSGGVDSSVVPLLLMKRGYDVVGITMQIWQESQTDPRHAGCCSLGAVEDARRVANILGFPHYVINFKEEFKSAVIEEFISEYELGRTPNPCVTCNTKVKFNSLLKAARELGLEKLATGHYARIRKNSSTGAYRLMKSLGTGKDQSYVLYGMNQDQLGASMFPLGELGDKAETRRLAREAGLPVADKPDSQDICFVSEAGGYREFLRRSKPHIFADGQLVSSSGEVIGSHQGVADFTIGQRRGLGVAAGRPLYVIGLEPQNNRVVLGSEENLLSTRVYLSEVNWSEGVVPSEPIEVMAKIRYNMDPKKAILHPAETPWLEFNEPVRAVTPGQAAVAYRGATLAAGGKILAGS